MTLSRRELLRLTGLPLGTAAALAALGACGRTAAGPVTGSTGAPQRGGTVRFTFVGAGATETMDPASVFSPAELARCLVVFDPLFTVVDGRTTPALALRAEPGAGARTVTITLRPGVTWHDGSELTARDVVFSLARLAAPDRPYPSELTTYLDVTRAVATGALTVRVPTHKPVGDPAGLLAGAQLMIVKNGTTAFTAGKLVGTGAYRLTGFAPGQDATLGRYDGHWNGPPNADTLVIASVNDAQARVNAVRAGQADHAADIPFAIARTGAGAADLEVRTAGEAQRVGYGFVMNTTRKPLADPRVRLALRLAVDRQALVDTVLLGYGAVANDLYGRGAQYFADDTPVLGRDVDRARSLLAGAGAAGAPLVIRSSDYETGLNAATQLYVEQLKQLGLKASAQLVGPAEAFTPAGLAGADLMAFPLGAFPLGVIYARSAAYPSLAFPDPELTRALGTALATTDEAARAAAWRTAQRVMADRGNWIVWGRADVLSLARRTVGGIQVRESAKYPYLGRAGLTG
ncbi:hypothetical protein GCM10010123_01110 [Pilimelia anulata]|uniref:Solute-binding protein family 5 domain-containing protein n=1 Tax=Pilimelia anulata TaxID=53371 RepID=A0A8J3F5S6_9ACTN|nr:ABC transporter substrate-binding protein [Pilimelia anulata]GGJ74908.1 hypothetical protein GCM10010123_01110 [Pilimelia anulata]